MPGGLNHASVETSTVMSTTHVSDASQACTKCDVEALFSRLKGGRSKIKVLYNATQELRTFIGEMHKSENMGAPATRWATAKAC